MSGLGLGSASASQGFDVIPAGTPVTLVMKIRPGGIGIEQLLKRTSKGDAEMLDAEFTVLGGEFDKRRFFQNMVLDGTTAGHATAAGMSRALLRAIYEAAHGIDPTDETTATTARRNNAKLVEFNGASFIAILDVEKGGKKPDGGGFYKDKNVIGKVLRLGDSGYRKLDQPPPSPIERSTPPTQSQAPAPATANGAPAVAAAGIAKPNWAQ